MAVPVTFVDGNILTASDLNRDFVALDTAITAKVSAPVQNNQLANDNFEIIIPSRALLAADLTAIVGTAVYVAGIPFDSVDGAQLYRLISYSIMSQNAALRATSAIFSVQSGSPANGWTNLATGLTIPIANGGALLTATTVGANLTNGPNAGNGNGGLRLVVTQQGVGYAGADFAMITLKFSRLNGLRST